LFFTGFSILISPYLAKCFNDLSKIEIISAYQIEKNHDSSDEELEYKLKI